MRTRTCLNIPNKDSVGKKGYHCKSTVYKPVPNKDDTKNREAKEPSTNVWEQRTLDRNKETTSKSGPFQLAEMVAAQVELAVARALKKPLPEPPELKENTQPDFPVLRLDMSFREVWELMMRK